MGLVQIAVTLVSTFTIYKVAEVFYRLFLHPLAKFPGPKWAAVTDWWELYQENDSDGCLFLKLDDLHEQYGPIIRIRPNEVHIKDPEWMDVLFTGSSHVRHRDPIVAHSLGTPLATIGTVSHHIHQKRRNAISPYFSVRSVNQIEPLLQRHAGKLFADLKGREGAVTDLSVYFLSWTTDLISDRLFGDPLGLFDDQERAREWSETLRQFSVRHAVSKQFPWLITLGVELPLAVSRVLQPSLVSTLSVYKDLNRRAREAYAEHTDRKRVVDEDEDDQNIFETILTSQLPQPEKAPKRMANEVFNLLIAGGLTTGRGASVGTFHVLSNPKTCFRLRSELRDAIPDASSSLPELRLLRQLPFLTAVVQETLRISTLVTSRDPLIAPEETLQYKDWKMPPGTTVSMTFVKAGLDPTVFPEPQEFVPDRWLAAEESVAKAKSYLLPFGKGQRICLGMHLAYAELYILFALVFRWFDLELFDTIRERDIDVKVGGPAAEPCNDAKGVRVIVKGMSEL